MYLYPYTCTKIFSAHYDYVMCFFYCSILITNPKLQVQHMNCVEVLDRVGGVLLLPNTELATTKQVAEFYGVPINTMQSVMKNNREELEANGMKSMSYSELKAVLVKASNGDAFESYSISRRGSTIFSKRTILLVGFLLEKSKIAQEVRNQALNVIENATDEHKTFEITKEKELLMAIMFASNEVERATAINEHLEWTNRHKKHLNMRLSNLNHVVIVGRLQKEMFIPCLTYSYFHDKKRKTNRGDKAYIDLIRQAKETDNENENAIKLLLTTSQWNTFWKQFKVCCENTLNCFKGYYV